MPSTARIMVRVVHDDPAAEAGLSAAFIRYPDLEVEVHDSIGGSALPPGPCGSTADVVVADYAHGIALAMQSARASNASNSPEVMILAGLDREWEIRYALARGVRGYLLVGCAFDEIADGVRAVHRGARHLSPRIAARLAESMSVEPLTAREEEVLRLVVEGLCNKSIGRRLDIAVGTVKSHLKSSFDKLDVCSRTQAMAAVERRGLLREPPQRPDLRRPCDVDRVPDAAARDAFERASTRGMRGLAARRSVLPEDSLQFLRVAGFG